MWKKRKQYYYEDIDEDHSEEIDDYIGERRKGLFFYLIYYRKYLIIFGVIIALLFVFFGIIRSKQQNEDTISSPIIETEYLEPDSSNKTEFMGDNSVEEFEGFKNIYSETKGLDSSNPVESRYELAEVLNYLILYDEETNVISSGIKIYVDNLSKDDFYEINDYINSAFFVAESYNFDYNLNGSIKSVTLFFNVTDNLYVYENIVKGIEIPKSESRAIEICQVVKEIINNTITENMTPLEKEVAVHDYLVRTCQTVDDVSDSDVYTSYGALVLHKSVCQGYASAFELIMTCLGFDCRFITGYASEPHGWNLIKIGTEWYHVDVTWDNPLTDDKSNNIAHTYLNVNDEIMSQSRTWERSDYVECNSLNYNYYVVNDSLVYSYEEFQNRVDKLVKMGTGNSLELAIMNYDGEIYDSSIVYECGYDGNLSWTENAVINGNGFQVIYINLY